MGGQEFLTTRQTLLSSNSIFRLVLKEEPGDQISKWKPKYWQLKFENRKKKPEPSPQLDMKAYYQFRRKEDNLYYLDRDPIHFEVVLNFLRHKKLIIPEDVNIEGIMEEARYLQVTELVAILQNMGISTPNLPKSEELFDDNTDNNKNKNVNNNNTVDKSSIVDQVPPSKE